MYTCLCIALTLLAYVRSALCGMYNILEQCHFIVEVYLMLLGSTSMSLFFIILNEEMSNDYEQKHQRSLLCHCLCARVLVCYILCKMSISIGSVSLLTPISEPASQPANSFRSVPIFLRHGILLSLIISPS